MSLESEAGFNKIHLYAFKKNHLSDFQPGHTDSAIFEYMCNRKNIWLWQYFQPFSQKMSIYYCDIEHFCAMGSKMCSKCVVNNSLGAQLVRRILPKLVHCVRLIFQVSPTIDYKKSLDIHILELTYFHQLFNSFY